VAQFVEAHWSVAEFAYDKHGPFVADALKDIADGAAILGAVRVPRFQKSASLRMVLSVTNIVRVSIGYQEFQKEN